MEIKSIKTNFVLKIIQFLGGVFILLTMPYIARKIGSENLGRVEYVNSIIEYIILFTVLGIPSYGIREIAKVRENIEERSKLTFEILSILSFTTFIGYIFLFLILYNTSFIKDEKILVLIISINILFNNIGVEWFYQGIEDQLYITIRYIFIRFIVIIATFLFVKKPEDYIKYGIILVLMSSGSNIFNLLNIKKYIKFNKNILKKLEIKKHFKPIMTIFLATISTSIYLKLDMIMLGNLSGVESVGYYSLANKLIRFVISVVTAFGVILLPRLSNYLKNKNKEGYYHYLSYSLKYILFISIPMTSIFFVFSEEIILLVGGSKFYESSNVLKLGSPIIFIVGLAYFIGFQILYPFGIEKYYTYSVTLAAIINCVFNYIFIPKFKHNGAICGTVIAELTGLVLMAYFLKRKLPEIKIFNIENLKYFQATGIMLIVMIFLVKVQINFVGVALIGGLVYICTLHLVKEKIIEGVIEKVYKNKNQLKKMN
jgi:O-antigen/teichoic acid export membrane protein